MAIAHIKNRRLRLTALVAAAPFLIIAGAVIGACAGMRDAVADIINACIINAWDEWSRT